MYKAKIFDYIEDPDKLKHLYALLEYTGELLVLVDEEKKDFIIIVSNDPYDLNNLKTAEKIAEALNAPEEQ